MWTCSAQHHDQDKLHSLLRPIMVNERLQPADREVCIEMLNNVKMRYNSSAISGLGNFR